MNITAVHTASLHRMAKHFDGWYDESEEYADVLDSISSLLTWFGWVADKDTRFGPRTSTFVYTHHELPHASAEVVARSFRYDDGELAEGAFISLSYIPPMAQLTLFDW